LDANYLNILIEPYVRQLRHFAASTKWAALCIAGIKYPGDLISSGAGQRVLPIRQLLDDLGRAGFDPTDFSARDLFVFKALPDFARIAGWGSQQQRAAGDGSQGIDAERRADPAR
jgi:hypothetical protein